MKNKSLFFKKIENETLETMVSFGHLPGKSYTLVGALGMPYNNVGNRQEVLFCEQCGQPVIISEATNAHGLPLEFTCNFLRQLKG